MKIKAEYKGKTIELDIPDEKLEELVKEQKKTGWEKAEFSYKYFAILSNGEVYQGVADIKSKEYERGNYFTSKELAKNIARYQSLDLRIRRRIAEICEPVNWLDTRTPVYLIMFDSMTRKLQPVHTIQYIHSIGWWIDTKEHAEQIIEEFKDELTWYFTEFKDRMDG